LYRAVSIAARAGCPSHSCHLVCRLSKTEARIFILTHLWRIFFRKKGQLQSMCTYTSSRASTRPHNHNMPPWKSWSYCCCSSTGVYELISRIMTRKLVVKMVIRDFAKHLRPHTVAPSPQRQGPGYLVQRVIFCFSPGSFDLTRLDWLHTEAIAWAPKATCHLEQSTSTVHPGRRCPSTVRDVAVTTHHPMEFLHRRWKSSGAGISTKFLHSRWKISGASIGAKPLHRLPPVPRRRADHGRSSKLCYPP
jgi:hypothetical protein